MKYISFLFLFFTLTVCKGQSPVTNVDNHQILDSILTVAQTHSLYANHVDWNTMRKESHALITSDSIMALKPSIEYLLSTLGDFHGFASIQGTTIKGKVQRKREVPYAYNTQDYYNSMSSIYKHYLKTPDINSQLLDSDIAYLNIPQIVNNSGDPEINKTYTQSIRQHLCRLDAENPKGYIIDLRANLGGNMYPMFSGLGLLFPNAFLGGDSSDGHKYNSKWSYKDTHFYYDSYTLSDLPEPSCKIALNQRPVVVLIGRYTSSSGEALASGLKGLPKVQLIGEQTAGASTTNSWTPITSNVAFNPAIAYYMSADRTLHTDGIIPDILMEDDFNFQTPLTSKAIYRAIQWIRNNKPQH